MHQYRRSTLGAVKQTLAGWMYGWMMCRVSSNPGSTKIPRGQTHALINNSPFGQAQPPPPNSSAASLFGTAHIPVDKSVPLNGKEGEEVLLLRLKAHPTPSSVLSSSPGKSCPSLNNTIRPRSVSWSFVVVAWIQRECCFLSLCSIPFDAGGGAHPHRGAMTGAAWLPPMNGHARRRHGVASFKKVCTLQHNKNVFGAISHDRSSHYTLLITFLERLPFATIAVPSCACHPDRITCGLVIQFPVVAAAATTSFK
jgi:hypothetical protein